jgi:Integrase core domain
MMIRFTKANGVASMLSAAASEAFAASIAGLAIENIDHTRTKTRSPQTNGICERFHMTLWDEFYRVAFRKRLDELQSDLDAWLVDYDQARPHQGRWCYGKTPMQTFLDTLPVSIAEPFRVCRAHPEKRHCAWPPRRLD